ncbi:MAG: glycoside hydrolase 5 family protein [Actinomycetota bacterium]
MSIDTTVTAGPHYLRRDGRSILPVGAHYVPVEGPDWPWRVGAASFDAAFASMAAAGMDTVRIDLLWAAVESEPGKLDEAHLTVLDEVLDAARRHGLLLHPTFFIGGEVGDAYWDVPWRDGRHPHRDPELLALQAAHVRAVARRWRGDPTIVAWDLTDEPPLWIFRDTTDDDARGWTATLVDALRDEDPTHLITIGTSGQEVGAGPFRADVVAERLDFACVHPYPIYQEELYPDALLSPRMTLAAAFETALASSAGKPVMVHEYGASSAQFDPERIAAYDRLLTWSSFGRGAIGYYAWCWTDAEPAAFGHVPYVRQPHETQFGVTDHTGTLRPRGRVLADAAARLRALDLDAVASKGPASPTAAIPVPHEYVHPYDPEAYGIADAPAGPYVPAETAWNPERDPRPLVRGWLNAFVLACRADLRASFPRERLDGVWPEVPVMLVPAPLTSTTTSLYHVRTDWWRGAEAHLARGGVLWLSCSADSAIPEMEAFAGCRLADRAPEGPATLRFAQPWGPFAGGDTLDLPAGDGSLHTRGVRLASRGAEVVATDGHGEPAIVRAATGGGTVVTCAYPVELLLAGLPDAHGPEDRSWGLYDGLVDLAGLVRPTGHPDAVAGVLLGETGSLTVVTNHGPTDLALTVTLPDGASVDAAIPAHDDVVLEGGLPA